MSSETLPEITVCEHSSSFHPQMQVKALSCKEEDICEHDEAVLKWTAAKWKTVLWSDELEFLFGNHGYCVLGTKEERNHSACDQNSV